MSDLTGIETLKLERLFRMSGGYVLGFSDRTIRVFFDEFRVDFSAEKYLVNGTSKANRLRTFWRAESNHTVGRTLLGIIEHALAEQWLDGSHSLLIEECRVIAQRLVSDQPVAELDVLVDRIN